MIFYLAGEDDFHPSPLTMNALENLAHAGKCGVQLIAGDRGALEFLAKCDDLSASSRSYFRRMAQWMTQIGTTLDEQEKLCIDLTNKSKPGLFGSTVPVDLFSKVDYCEKSQLLTENLTDFNVLVELAKLYLKERLPGYALNLRPQNGGGNTTAQVLREIGGSPSGPVFCFADSDRRFAGDALGATARAIRATKVTDQWRVDSLVIEARELENILPYDLVRRVAEANKMQAEGVDSTLKLPVEYLFYCSFKEGDHLCRMITSASAKSRQDVISMLMNLIDVAAPKVSCCGTCPVGGTCFSSVAFGANFLRAVERFLNRTIFVTDVSLWCSDLTRAVKKVIAFGLVMEPQRV
ncbi:MAG TPA: hypothetical protein VFD87_10475 [Phototrophicaceae bacterium]|nr:hypothetical protein [Phototrophicaceae bacterium]